MIKKVFKTTVIVIVMALMSATATFAQTGNDNNGLNPTGSDPFTKLYVKVFVPIPNPPDINKLTAKVTATITWYYGSGDQPLTQTQTMTGSDFEDKWVDFPVPFNTIMDPAYVEYRVTARTIDNKHVCSACGTFDITGISNTLFVSSWPGCFVSEEAWDDPFDPGSTD